MIGKAEIKPVHLRLFRNSSHDFNSLHREVGELPTVLIRGRSNQFGGSDCAGSSVFFALQSDPAFFMMRASLAGGSAIH